MTEPTSSSLTRFTVALVYAATAATLLFWGAAPGTPNGTPEATPPMTDLVGAHPRAIALPQPAATTLGESLRRKGHGPLLVAHRQVHGAVERLWHGATVDAGDLVQFSYVAAGVDHGAILSVDGWGVVTRHYPLPPETSTALGTDGLRSLPFAFELDDAPSYERVLFFGSDRPIDVPALVETLRAMPLSPHAQPAPVPAVRLEHELLLRKPTGAIIVNTRASRTPCAATGRVARPG